MNVSKLLLTLSSALLLSSCMGAAVPLKTTTPSAETAVPDPVKTVCTVLKPVYYSKADTQQTKNQVQQLNAAIVGLCPQYKPAAK